MWRAAGMAGSLLISFAACTLAVPPTSISPTAPDVVLANNQDFSSSTATGRRRKKLSVKDILKQVSKRLAKLEKWAGFKSPYTTITGHFLAGYAGGDQTPSQTFGACKTKCDSLGSKCAGCTCETSTRPRLLQDGAELKASHLQERHELKTSRVQ